jgi:hypothetical protein
MTYFVELLSFLHSSTASVNFIPLLTILNLLQDGVFGIGSIVSLSRIRQVATFGFRILSMDGW